MEKGSCFLISFSFSRRLRSVCFFPFPPAGLGDQGGGVGVWRENPFVCSSTARDCPVDPNIRKNITLFLTLPTRTVLSQHLTRSSLGLIFLWLVSCLMVPKLQPFWKL